MVRFMIPVTARGPGDDDAPGLGIVLRAEC
jgi:hypothetical protein